MLRELLEQPLASLPAPWRSDPTDPDSPRILVRSDSAGATHACAEVCRERGVGFSFGYPVDARVQNAVDTLNLGQCWYPAMDSEAIRDGAWVAEASNLPTWPSGTRLILRKEHPHSGAQLRFTDADGMRVTAFITDTPDFVAWAKLVGLTDGADLARREISAFRYRVLRVAARITHSARQLRLRSDATWRWGQVSPQPGTGSAPPSPNHPPRPHRAERPSGPEKPATPATSATRTQNPG